MKPHFDAVQSLLRDGSENLQSLKERDRELGETQTCSACNAETVAVAGGVKRKALRGIQYKMEGFLEQCVDAYISLAKVRIDSLKKVATPSLGEHSFTEK